MTLHSVMFYWYECWKFRLVYKRARTVVLSNRTLFMYFANFIYTFVIVDDAVTNSSSLSEVASVWFKAPAVLYLISLPLCRPSSPISGVTSGGRFRLLVSNRQFAMHAVQRSRKHPAATKIGTPTVFHLNWRVGVSSGHAFGHAQLCFSWNLWREMRKNTITIMKSVSAVWEVLTLKARNDSTQQG